MAMIMLFQVNEIIILTNENACLRYFVSKMVRSKIPILVVGPTGTGKSSLVLNFLLSLPKERYITNTINFSARTTANQVSEFCIEYYLLNVRAVLVLKTTV